MAHTVLNCVNCLNKHSWNVTDFLNAPGSAEQVRIMLCPRCYKSLPVVHWLMLKQKVLAGISGAGNKPSYTI